MPKYRDDQTLERKVLRLPKSAREVVESSALAYLTTLNADGSPQVTAIWVGMDGDEIVSAHLQRWRKVKNVEQDPRVALSIEAPGTNELGLRNYLVIYGRARIETGGAPELLQKLAHLYLGPDVRFPPIEDPPAGYLTRITPERLAGIGPWASS